MNFAPPSKVCVVFKEIDPLVSEVSEDALALSLSLHAEACKDETERKRINVVACLLDKLRSQFLGDDSAETRILYAVVESLHGGCSEHAVRSLGDAGACLSPVLRYVFHFGSANRDPEECVRRLLNAKGASTSMHLDPMRSLEEPR